MKWKAWLGKWRVYQMFYLAFAAAIALAVQAFMFPLAGKKAQDHGAIYAFQNDIWSDQVFRRLEEISRSAPYDELALIQKRTPDPSYLNKVTTFHSQIRQILRLLGYQGKLTAGIVGEMVPMLQQVNADARPALIKSVKTHLQMLEKEASRQKKMREELEGFDAELRRAYAPAASSTTNKVDAAEQRVKQIRAILTLYSKPELLLRPGEDPLVFLKDFGRTQDAIFKDYTSLVAAYNQTVETQEFGRDLVMIALALITACLLFNAELKAWRSRNEGS